MKPRFKTAVEGARSILQGCLCLEPSELVLVVCDNTTEDLLAVFNAAATQINVPSIGRVLTQHDRRMFLSNQVLPVDLLDKIDGARAVLTCLSSSPSGTSLRAALIRAATSANRRVGHMPGITLALLATAIRSGDPVEIEEHCSQLALALLVGEKATLTTFASPNEPHILTLELGGFSRSPITSTGVIPLGTWGNVPGGETFIAPLEDSANGTFVLNGSFTKTIIPDGEPIILFFKNGMVERLEGPPILCSKLRALTRKTPHLGELGLGVNGGIEELTGCSLIDEKCAGTIHIALGDNLRYGGKIDSPIHEDLVTRCPTLEIDGRCVIQNGHYVFRNEDWLANIDYVVPDPQLASPFTAVRRTLVRGVQDACEGLSVERSVIAERICKYAIGDPHTNKILWDVYRSIPGFPNSATVDALASVLSGRVDMKVLESALTLLLTHQLLEVARRR